MHGITHHKLYGKKQNASQLTRPKRTTSMKDEGKQETIGYIGYIGYRGEGGERSEGGQ